MLTQARSHLPKAIARVARFFAAGAFLFAVGTAPAFANAGMGVQVIFPPSITVGQTNVAGVIDIQNTSTPDSLTIDLNTITLVPACGAYSIITCTQLDPGVLSINTPAVGRALTACAGVSFTVAPTGQPDGSYSFTPASTIQLGTPGSATDRCIIDFTFNVLKAPTKDANGTSNGLQTLPSALVTGTANDTSQAVGFGTAFFVTVDKGNPSISTTASQAVVAGGNIFDTATLSGGTNPTGTITFKLYGPNDVACATAIFTSVKNVNGNGNYQSDPFGANLAGVYRWIASYSGDANNNQAAGTCNAEGESVTVTPGTPSLTTNASAAIKLGGSVTDTATLLSGISPTGSITFKLYGPNDTTCANPAVFTSNPVTVNGNGNYTSTPAYTPTAIGTYRWIASYTGDANNNPITGLCNDANESVVVNQATPTLATTASGNVVIGNAVSDTANLAGGAAPTGTIIFKLYGPSSAVSCVDSGAGANLVFTSAAIPVSGNGAYPSGSFTPTLPGTYRWRATYSGDTNNVGLTGACGATGETVMIAKATPTLSTIASAGGVIGTQVNDSATLGGGYGTLTGTLIFRLYGPSATNTCTDGSGGNLVFTSSAVTVNGAGVYPSPTFTPLVAGTYRWRATYSGDSNNNSSVGTCGATNESVTITKASPTIATQASPGGVIGTLLTDTATVSGGSSPTGTVTFSLYGPNNTSCSGSPIFTSTNALVGAVATSGAYTTTAAGDYRWTVVYNGDANNNTAAGLCNALNEMATITKTTPTISTLASAGGTVGTALSDTATVTGSSPTGSVTFNLYGPNDASCSGASIFTATVSLAGGIASSGTFTPSAPGLYRWTASYGGDANNIAVSHPCNSLNESATISKRSPTIATQASPGGAIGTALTDTATLTGALTPTGTVTFNLYGPNDASCSGAVIFTSTNNVVGVSATSGAFTTVAAGVYRWTASYSGDANNNAVSHPCNSTNESATISKSSPTIATQASAGGAIGTALTDTATLTGATSPTGTVTFNLYGPNDASCSGAVIFTSTNPISGVSATSGSFTTVAAGVYRWTASYSGDANNNAVSHPCNSTNESATISKSSPTIATQASAGGAIGTALTDTATLTGATSPTGTVTFNLYGPNDASCSGAVIFTSTNPISGVSATSGAFTTVAAGVYRWTASYSGDANNNAVSHPCNSTNESATISKSSPTIATQASAGGAIGTALTDTATLTGATSPTGTVTFNLYGPNDASCSGAVIFTSTNPISGVSATSGSFTTVSPGVYRWTASYSGDANNNAVSHPCNSTNESATIGKSTPTIATQASAGGILGVAVLSDTATVSGGTNPTGTVTFNLYGPDDASCTGAVAFTSTNPLSGGTATSGNFTPTLQGVYRWTASYSGDANNINLSHPCNSPNESATIIKPKEVPTIGTVASAGGPLGTALTDTATVTSTVTATGTVTFTLYGPDDASCSGGAIFTSTTTLSGGTTTSGSFTPTAPGVYRWRALYNGDANNDPVIASCNAPNESATITKVTPTLVTQTTPIAIVGDTISDTATLSGGTAPTGTITFRLYGPNDASCTNAPIFTSSAVTVNGNGSYPSSPGFVAAVAGTYHWIASYTGDASNAAVTGACNDANENVSVTSRAPPPPDTPIPTLSEWTLMLLVMMMGGVAMASLRSRRRR